MPKGVLAHWTDSVHIQETAGARRSGRARSHLSTECCGARHHASCASWSAVVGLDVATVVGLDVATVVGLDVATVVGLDVVTAGGLVCSTEGGGKKEGKGGR
jgi:hypothetical protein